MKARQHLICIATILFLAKTSKGIKNIKPKIDVHEESPTALPYYTTTDGESETTTEHYEMENNSSESALEEIRSNHHNTLQNKEEDEYGGEIGVVESPNVVEVNFPENHKNFTPSLYLGTGEFPYYVYVNPYRQQYEAYYDQKDLYGRKPIRFEENTPQDYIAYHQFAHGDNEEGKLDYSRFNVKPFPYLFENHQFVENSADTGTIQQHSVHEDRPLNWDYGFTTNDHKQNSFHYNLPEKVPQDFSNTDVFHVQNNNNYEVGKYYKQKNPWKKILHLLTALVPLGLFLATLSPSIISVNASSPGKIGRQRSTNPEDEFNFKEEDILKLAREYGVESLNESQCEDRIICELAKMGEESAANSIEKGFLYLAHRTPQDVAEGAGMAELFQAIKTGNCKAFKCEARSGANVTFPVKKKILRKRKVQRKIATDVIGKKGVKGKMT